MTNEKYWAQRFEQLEKAALDKGLDYFEALEREYKLACEKIQADIARWYERFAENNQITLADARKWLDKGELKEFKWTLDDYVQHGIENVDGRWTKQLENASARVHINRFEALQMNLQQQIEILYGNQSQDMKHILGDIYKDTYYHSAYEIQKGNNIGFDISGIDGKKLDKVLSKPWTLDKRTFSDNIWKDKEALLNTLQTDLTQSFIRGDNLNKVITDIAERFEVSEHQAKRLVMTESAYFSSQAELDSYKELGLEECQILATLDLKTSAICQGLDGKIVKVSEAEPGVTVPPFHPNCRTTTVPYFNDNFGERAARNSDDEKTYYVPANMTYPEWYDKYVDHEKDDLKKARKDDIVNKISFEPAKNIREAEEFALNELNIAANYQKYNLDIANAVNKSIVEMRNVFGVDCFENGLHSIGTFPKGYSTRVQGAFAWYPQTEIGDLWLRNVSSKGALEKLFSVAQEQFKIGHWSTGEALHTIRHELGHALTQSIKQRGLSGTIFEEITDLKSKIQSDIFKNKGGTAMYAQYLSKYAFTNTKEFIAESVAEYMAGNPRETALKVISILLKALKG